MRAPYGSWRSPLDAGLVARAGRRLSMPRVRGEDVFWLEGRPEEGGRQALLRAGADGVAHEVSAPGADVRSRVHEYGGGEYALGRGVLAYVDRRRPGIQLAEAGGERPVPGSETGARHADLAFTPDARFLLAVEEEHPEGGGEPANRLVAFDLAAGRRGVLVEDADFVASPVLDGEGARVAWIAWDHPRMPWDGTRLFVAELREGRLGARRALAGGPRESVLQPRFGPDGRLVFVSDRSGWWNLYQEREGGAAPLAPRSAEFARPPWVLGLTSYGFARPGALLCAYSDAATYRVARLELETGVLRNLPVAAHDVEALDAADGRAAFVGASPTEPAAVFALDPESGEARVLRRASSLELPEGLISIPQAVRFPSAEGRQAYAFLYRPRHPEFQGSAGTRPPLIVKGHGGPTSATSASLKLGIQYWTSRGFAVADVDYGGSSGHGRAYRDLLIGAWGVVDVDDCVHAARFAVAEGWADPARLAITGGSAGGFTTLCALTFRDDFAVGASYYGVGDLEALARDTHKFESRYLDTLVGPWPARRDLYRERSPLHHAERLARPVIFFQGGRDRVVPPAQAEAMVAALARRGVPHAYVLFPDEEHGFRRAENVARALEEELAFYCRVLGL